MPHDTEWGREWRMGERERKAARQLLFEDYGTGVDDYVLEYVPPFLGNLCEYHIVPMDEQGRRGWLLIEDDWKYLDCVALLLEMGVRVRPTQPPTNPLPFPYRPES